LFNDKVIKASRDFVCIRLATYEDEAEADFLKTIYLGRSGVMENTTFVMLSPDTKRDLCRAGRSPQHMYRSPATLALEMKEIAEEFKPTRRAGNERPILPQIKDVRLGINVSSCDGLPAVVCVANSDEQAEAMRSLLAPHAFCPELAGKFVYASTTDSDDLKIINGYRGKPGFVLVEPGDYGTDGKQIKFFAPEAESDAIKSAMIAYANSVGRVEKNHRSHVRTGLSQGSNWETEIPVTDPGSVKSMERNKQQRTRGNR
jgi:hypothetical protein